MNNNGSESDGEPSRSSHPGARHVVTELSGIYLEAGLPLEAAIRSAIADYESYLQDESRLAS